MRKMCLMILATACVTGAITAGAADVQQDAAKLKGVVIKASAIPDPKTADYEDCLTYLKFKVEETVEGKVDADEILLVTWAFEDLVLAESAKIAEGQHLEISVVPYDSVAEEYDTYMRVDDTDDYSSPIYWLKEWSTVGDAKPAAEEDEAAAKDDAATASSERAPEAVEKKKN